MDLRKKLQRLRQASQEGEAASNRFPPAGEGRAAVKKVESPLSPAGEGEAREREDRIARLRLLIDKVVEKDRRTFARAPRAQPARWEELPGKQVDTAHGPLHICEQMLEPDHCHGRVAIGSALGVSNQLVAELALDPSLVGVDLGRMLILDTETTGLAGGTGTVAFLIGLAWFEQGVLRVEQLLLRRFGQEAPLLHRLAEVLERSSCLVTYNGKCFDWPLLRTRFVMNRLPAPPDPPHIDLLHCARRVYRPRMDDLRLTDVEQQVLGFYREGDVDGSEIPDIYLRFLNGSDPRPMLRVLEHNANDLIALAAILGKLGRHFHSVQRADDPRDHLAFARLASRAGDHERALSFATAAVEGTGSDNVAVDALVLTARLARGQGDHQAQAQALHRALSAGPDQEAAAAIHLALAKLYEHKLKDFRRALEHAQQAAEAEGEECNARRLQRIELKAKRRAG
jgi:uncharacterized protein YprB with RNaseH-like and TPR domain